MSKTSKWFINYLFKGVVDIAEINLNAARLMTHEALQTAYLHANSHSMQEHLEWLNKEIKILEIKIELHANNSTDNTRT